MLRLATLVAIVFLASIPAFITQGQTGERLDNLENRLETKADVALVEMQFNHQNEKLDSIIMQLADIKKQLADLKIKDKPCPIRPTMK